MWSEGVAGQFSSSRLRTGDPVALLSPERFNRQCCTQGFQVREIWIFFAIGKRKVGMGDNDDGDGGRGRGRGRVL